MRIPESAPFPLTSGGGNVWTGTVLWTLGIEIGSDSQPKPGSVRRWARVDEDEGDRRGRARRLRRDADVLRRYRGALATHLHKQRNRTAQQRDKAQNLHDQHISRRNSALMLVAGRLKYIAYREWDSCCSLDASLSKEQPSQRLAEFAQKLLTIPRRGLSSLVSTFKNPCLVICEDWPWIE